MLESWGSILDPIYGEGTARALLYTENSSYIYEDGAKYQQIFTEGNIAYRLVRVYQTDRTAFRIKEERWKLHQAPFMDAMIWKFF